MNGTMKRFWTFLLQDSLLCKVNIYYREHDIDLLFQNGGRRSGKEDDHPGPEPGLIGWQDGHCRFV
jgi:hypothetical protein